MKKLVLTFAMISGFTLVSQAQEVQSRPVIKGNFEMQKTSADKGVDASQGLKEEKSGTSEIPVEGKQKTSCKYPVQGTKEE